MHLAVNFLTQAAASIRKAGSMIWLDSWRALPDMPHPRHGLGAVVHDEAIYVIGWALKASGVDTSALVEVFRP